MADNLGDNLAATRIPAAAWRALAAVAVGVAAKFAIDWKIKQIRSEVLLDLSDEQVITILKEMALVDYPLLTDLSQIASPLLQFADAEGFADALLSDKVRASLVAKELAILETHGLVELPNEADEAAQLFRNFAETRAAENPTIFLLLVELKQMITDAAQGRLPLLPAYKPNPEMSADDLLKILSQVQAAQRLGTEHVVRHIMATEGPEACLAFLPSDEKVDQVTGEMTGQMARAVKAAGRQQSFETPDSVAAYTAASGEEDTSPNATAHGAAGNQGSGPGSEATRARSLALHEMFAPPRHVSRLLRQEMRIREDMALATTSVDFGGRHNFHHTFASFARDAQFAARYKLLQELHNERTHLMLVGLHRECLNAVACAKAKAKAQEGDSVTEGEASSVEQDVGRAPSRNEIHPRNENAGRKDETAGRKDETAGRKDESDSRNDLNDDKGKANEAFDSSSRTASNRDSNRDAMRSLSVGAEGDVESGPDMDTDSKPSKISNISKISKMLKAGELQSSDALAQSLLLDPENMRLQMLAMNSQVSVEEALETHKDKRLQLDTTHSADAGDEDVDPKAYEGDEREEEIARHRLSSTSGREDEPGMDSGDIADNESDGKRRGSRRHRERENAHTEDQAPPSLFASAESLI